MPAHPIPALEMSDRHLRILRKERHRKVVSVRTIQRISILVNGAAGMSNFQSGQELGIKVDTITVWRERWQSNYALLQEFEKGVNQSGVSDRELLKKILELLKDAPGRGRPKVITEEQERQITALACEAPKDHGVQATQWSHMLLAKTAISKGIIGYIAGRTVGSILKKTKNGRTTRNTGFSPK